MTDFVHAQDFERSDASPWLIVALATGLAAIVIALMLGLAALFPQALVDRPKGPIDPLPPQPRLQVRPSADLARTEAAEAKRLRNIDAAERRVAAEGWRE